jgi:hypothetical protein
MTVRQYISSSQAGVGYGLDGIGASRAARRYWFAVNGRRDFSAASPDRYHVAGGCLMITKRVNGFKPSTSAFQFANAFDDGPVLTIRVPPFGEIPVGNAALGLCGGMVFAALDFLQQGRLPPSDTVAPKPGTPLYQFLCKRLLDSFNGARGIFKYLDWMRFPDESHLFGSLKSIAWHTVNDEWPNIRADLDQGQACPLGLVQVESVNPFDLGKNHQVLAYGYDLDESAGDLSVLVYDPNSPDDDGVTLTLNLANPQDPSRVVFSANPNARGFFRNIYAPVDPGDALETS